MARRGRGTSMTGILERVLECDVFFREPTIEIGPAGVWRGNWRWRVGCDGCLLGWRAVVGVLEDSWLGLAWL
jgi:hypothetical protein